MYAEGLVEHQKRTQTAALLSFGFVFGVQLGSLEKITAWTVSCRNGSYDWLWFRIAVKVAVDIAISVAVRPESYFIT